jgi:hypothetical protein
MIILSRSFGVIGCIFVIWGMFLLHTTLGLIALAVACFVVSAVLEKK